MPSHMPHEVDTAGGCRTRLGYPTKNALKSWHREFERCRDLPMRYVRSKPKYSVEQKKLAVDHYRDHGRCMTVTIKALGYPGRDSLTTWINELLSYTGTCFLARSFRQLKAYAQPELIFFGVDHARDESSNHRMPL
jgi:hypothetical protein